MVLGLFTTNVSMVVTRLFPVNLSEWVVAEERMREASVEEILTCLSPGGLLEMMKTAEDHHVAIEGWCSGCLGVGARRKVKIDVSQGSMEGVVMVGPNLGVEACEW